MSTKKSQKNHLPARGIEPRTACMLNGYATPTPWGEVDFVEKFLFTHLSVDLAKIRLGPYDPRNKPTVAKYVLFLASVKGRK